MTLLALSLTYPQIVFSHILSHLYVSFTALFFAKHAAYNSHYSVKDPRSILLRESFTLYFTTEFTLWRSQCS